MIIGEFNRDSLSFSDDRDAVWRHDARTLGEFALSHAPAVHDANPWANRLIGWMCQSVEDANQHELAISLLANIITKQAGL